MDPLITTGELDDYLQRAVPPAPAALAVQGASGAVRGYCRWGISQELAVTLRVTADGGRALCLPTLHLTAVDAVSVDGVALAAGSYRWVGRGQLYRDAPWPRWSTVEVVCDHGYAEVPDVVRLVALGVAARYASNPENLRIASVGSVQRTFAALGLTNLESGLLDEFRLP